MWSVVALTVATFTMLLAARRILMVGGALVFSRYVAVGGLVAFSVTRDGDEHRVRFEVGGPGVFHNVTVALFGAQGVGYRRCGTPWPPVTRRSSGRSGFPTPGRPG